MKMVKSLLLGSAAGLVAVSGAQAADLPVKAKPVEYVKICTLYGDGFFYIPGTDTCVRLGGAVMADNFYNTLSNGHIHFDAKEGAQDRTVPPWSMRVRVDLAWDSRTQTDYGTLRTFVQMRIDNGDGGTNTLNEPRGYIQWAGFTFGHTRSYSDPFATWGGGDGFGSMLQAVTHPDSGANGTNQIAYTFELGNGMVFVFGADERRNNPLVNLSVANQISVGGGATTASAPTSRAGMVAPDPYVAFRMSQAWGNFSLAAHTNLNNALYYTGTTPTTGNCPVGQTGTTLCDHPTNKMGWAILSGIQINLPWIAAGDRIGAFFTYGQGATKYAGGQNLGSPDLFGAGNQLALGIQTDGVFVNGGAIQLTTGWVIGTAFEHWWTPQLKTSLYYSHSEISYNNTVISSRVFCNNTAAGASATSSQWTVAGVCDPGFKFWDARAGISWYPVPGFRIGAEIAYTAIETAFAGQVITLTKTNGARPTGAYAARDEHIWAAVFRANRGFGAVGGD
jgi:hypothetical protein